MKPGEGILLAILRFISHPQCSHFSIQELFHFGTAVIQRRLPGKRMNIFMQCNSEHGMERSRRA
ncbi:unnamed protein product [Larinioides sclopetarius]|uniref:Uncharacterized protein n=1 Tax=Larinioides sclopetarius TaxID=280406 RepID=A0AAV2BT96_9ARAC